MDAVVLKPLVAEWEKIKSQIAKKGTSGKRRQQLFAQFLERLRGYRVLDPACGSGNFLYIALLTLKDLEHRVGLEAEALGLARPFPSVGPSAVLGIELNRYAAELARVTVWIGEIQWMKKRGFGADRNPILKPLNNIATRDALLNEDGSAAAWPSVDAIVGNPPFLGSRKMGPELGDAYTSNVRKVHSEVVPEGADLVCFWFAKAWQMIEQGRTKRVGLIATNSISGGASRKVLEPIADKRAMFEVWRDQPWVVEGADVDVSIICYADEPAKFATVNGVPVDRIFADLYPPSSVSALDLTTARRLAEDAGVSFQGIVPRSNVKKARAKELGLAPASFVMPGDLARKMLASTGNPNGRPNSDVVVPYLIGNEIGKRPLDRFIVDFGLMSETEASRYELPFEYIRPVKAHRAAMAQPEALATWWQHWRPRPDMKSSLKKLTRYVATSRVSKHRIFVWRSWPMLPDNAVVAIARDDDVSFGVLHSKFHRIWSLRMGTSLQNRPRYTSTTTFETFPFPRGLEPTEDAAKFASPGNAQDIAEAARELDQLRSAWLNPAHLIAEVDEVVVGYPKRLVPTSAEAAKELKKRTLVSLYNHPPAWLVAAHKKLDDAVAEAYQILPDADDDAILQHLLGENLARLADGAESSDDEEDMHDSDSEDESADDD